MRGRDPRLATSTYPSAKRKRSIATWYSAASVAIFAYALSAGAVPRRFLIRLLRRAPARAPRDFSNRRTRPWAWSP